MQFNASFIARALAQDTDNSIAILSQVIANDMINHRYAEWFRKMVNGEDVTTPTWTPLRPFVKKGYSESFTLWNPRNWNILKQSWEFDVYDIKSGSVKLDSEDGVVLSRDYDNMLSEEKKLTEPIGGAVFQKIYFSDSQQWLVEILIDGETITKELALWDLFIPAEKKAR